MTTTIKSTLERSPFCFLGTDQNRHSHCIRNPTACGDEPYNYMAAPKNQLGVNGK